MTQRAPTRLLKLVLWTLGVVVLLLGLLYLSLQFQPVQQFVVNKVTDRLSKTLGAPVSIGRVDIEFVKTLDVQDIYIEDLQGDTLLFASSLKADVSLFSFWKKEFFINTVALDGAVLDMNRGQEEEDFNFQFVIDAFASDTKDTTTSGWSFGVDKIRLSNSVVRNLDTRQGTEFEANLGLLLLYLDKLDVENQSVDIRQIGIAESSIRYQTEGLSQEAVDTSRNFAFPYSGWDVFLKQLRAENTDLKYDDLSAVPLSGYVDPSHLMVTDLDVFLDNFRWQEKEMSGEIDRFHFMEKSGFVLENLQGDFSWDQRGLSLDELLVETPRSTISNTTRLEYDDLNNFNDFVNSVRVKSVFNNTSLSLHDLTLLVPALDNQNFLETRINQPIELQGSVDGVLNNLKIKAFDLSMGQYLDIVLDGSVNNVAGNKDLGFNVNLRHFETSYNALNRITRDIKFPEGIAPWGKFYLSGKFVGRVNDFKGQNISLTTGSVTGFKGDAHITGLPDIDATVFDLDIEDLRTVSKDLAGFTAYGLPPAMDSLGQFYYQGSFLGNIYDFELDGRISSEVGDIQTNIDIAFNKAYTNATYSGDISTDSFQIGRVLGQESMGIISMDVNAFGYGLDSDSLRATVLGEVKEFTFNNYNYQGLRIDGRFDKMQFAGNAQMEDENLSFEYDGVIDLGASAKFKFDASIDTIDLQALNLLDQPFRLSTRISSDFKGDQFDKMKGDVTLRNIHMSNLEETYSTDRIYIVSDNQNDEDKRFLVESEFLNLALEGKFILQDLPQLLVRYVDYYFPLDGVETVLVKQDSSMSSPKELAEQAFSLYLSLNNIAPIVSLLDPNFQKLDTLTLSGAMDSEHHQLTLNGYIHELEYGGMRFGPMTYNAAGDVIYFDQVLQISDAELPGSTHFPFIYADLGMANDTAYISVIADDMLGDTIQERVSFAAMATRLDDLFQIKLHKVFVLNGREWSIDPNNLLQVGSNSISVRDLALERGGQRIDLSTMDADGTISNDLRLGLKNFELEEITQLLQMEDAAYKGKINGDVTLEDLVGGGSTKYLASLNIDSLLVRNELLGDLVVSSRQRTQDIIDVLIKLEGGASGLDVRGTYNLSNQALNIGGEIDRMDLRAIDPFLKGLAHDSRGKISGQLNLGGTVLVPVLNGSLELEEASTIFDFMQTRYTIPSESVSVRNNVVQLENFVIKDEKSNEATVNGTINYESNEAFLMNLQVNTDRFQILNTNARDNPLFHGQLYVSADVTVSGTSEAPQFLLNARTLDSTDFTVQPLTYEASFQQEDFIIFANPEEYAARDTSSSVEDLYQLPEYGFDMTANIEVTPEAQLTIVVDPATGDRLECRGQAELSIDMSSSGEIQVLGNYEITEGKYAFNFQRVLRRTFDIAQGSRVTFSGDPRKAKFDIDASYQVKTTTYELIKNQSTLNAAEEGRSKQRADVAVQLNLSGDLEDPVAKFDITTAETGNGLTSTVSSKLSQLREDENAMNKQVFGLLIFNSFLAEEQTTGNDLLSGAGQSVILSSVSNLLTSQLNRLAKKYIKGVNLDFGLDSYSNDFSDESDLITEVQVGLSKRLLNDRLNLKIGGNVQFENDANLNFVNQQNSTFSGDFVLEYKLTEDGDYNLRFFQLLSNEANIFNPGVNYSETGVAVFFTKSFNSKRYQLQLDNASSTKEDK